MRLTWLLFLGALAGTAGAQPPPPWNLSDTGQAGQWTIYNRSANSSALGYPLAAGDLNGDGRDDLILTPMNAPSGPARDRTGAGEVVIVLSDGTIAGERDLATLDVAALPADTIILYGANPHDYLGTEVTSADLDGDGFDDAIVGAQYGDGAGEARANCGEVVVFWGGAGPAGRVIDLQSPPAGAVTVIAGADSGDRLGVWVSAADVNGDGIADAILGSDQANGPGDARPHAGETTVLYGGAALRQRAAIDLGATDLPRTVIYGIDPEDHSGATVRGADLDGDGIGDVLIGAGLNRLSAQQGPTGVLDGHGSGGGDGPNNSCSAQLGCEIGEAYVVYGVAGGLPATFDLANPNAPITTVYGVDQFDVYGEELFAGDFDGDGFGDLAIGALTADGPGNTSDFAGETALVYGGAGLRGASINLATAPAGVSVIYGARSSAISGDTTMLVDLDGDGRDELVVASPGDRRPDGQQTGTVYVFFGSAGRLPASVDLANLPSGLAYIEIDGVRALDMLAYSMSLGDVDGDGLRDLILNAMGADGFLDRLTTAGDAYVLDAAELSRAAGREVVSPAPTPTATATSPASPTPPTPTPTTPPVCAGDCDANGAVSIDELITGVRIALEAAAVSACAALDRDASGAVDVAELVAAVTRSLEGC